MLVAELRRVTVLWDELWLGVLLQQHMYVLRRIQQLEDEVKRVQNNNTLRKYVLVMIIPCIIKKGLFLGVKNSPIDQWWRSF